MLALPIPMIVSLALIFLLIHSTIKQQLTPPLLVLIAACAGQSFLIALTQYYGISELRYIQPVTATFIPVLAFLAFRSTAISDVQLKHALPHGLAPLFVLFCMLFARFTVDLAVMGIFAVYGVAILVTLAKGNDSLTKVSLESGERPRQIWSIVAASLLLSPLSDLLIIIDYSIGTGQWKSIIITLFSSITLLTVGLVCLMRNVQSSTLRRDDKAGDIIDHPGEIELMHRLDKMMREQKLFLETDMSIARLARKLQVPAKALSAATNRVKGENISRYINAFRIHHACEKLSAGDNVTSAMYDSGFNTKSNFNREIARVTGQSPSQWIAAQNNF